MEVAELLKQYGMLGVCAFVLIHNAKLVRYVVTEFSKKLTDLTAVITTLHTTVVTHDAHCRTAFTHQRNDHDRLDTKLDRALQHPA